MVKTFVRTLKHIDAGDRRAMQAMQMKDWLDQQMAENALKRQMANTDKK